MKEFNKKTLNVLRKDLNKAISDVLKTHGLTGKVEGMRYTSADVTAKIQIGIGDVDDKIQREWKRSVFKIAPLVPDNFGATFIFNEKKFTIAGVMPRARKNVIIGMDSKGKKFRFDACDVSDGLVE